MYVVKNIRIVSRNGAAAPPSAESIAAITAALEAYGLNGAPSSPFIEPAGKSGISPWVRAGRLQILNKRSRRGTWQINMGY